MRKSGMRFISAALAACMMASVLPVSAFATGGGGTESESSVSGQAETVTVIPTTGMTITKGGTYEIQGDDYTGRVTVNITDAEELQKPVTIKIIGDVAYKRVNDIFILIQKAGTVTIENDGHTVDCTAALHHFMDVYAGDVTVQGGTYKTKLRNLIMVYGGHVTLNDFNGETYGESETGYAVTCAGATVDINRGVYKHVGTGANKAVFWAFSGGTINLNDVKATSDEYVIYNTSTVKIDGGTYQSGEGYRCVVNSSASFTVEDGEFTATGASCIDNNWGQLRINGGNFTSDSEITIRNRGGLRLNGGTVEAPNGTAIDISGESGDTQLNGGTIRNSATGVRITDAGDSEITLKAVTFEDNTDDISLGKDQKINIKKSFAGTAKLWVDDPAQGRQITTDNEDSPYQKNLNLISRNEGYVIGCKKVTDGEEFRYLAPADGCIVTAEDAVATADLGAGEQTLDSTTVVPVGTPVTVTAVQPGNGTFMGWTVQREDGSVVTDLLNPSEDDETTAAFTMPDYNVKVTAVYQTDSIDPGEGGSGDGCGIVGAVLAGGVLAWGAYEAGTDIYRVVSMQGAPMPTDRIELAKLLWEKAGKPEPEAVVVYSDMEDEDVYQNKAASWAVEQEILNVDHVEGKQLFRPYARVSKLRVCTTWEQAKQKGLIQ